MITNKEILKRLKSLETRVKKLESENIQVVGKPDENDILLSEAIAASKPLNKLSCSYLQRKLMIGYARAARIMKELEKLGIVGPDTGGHPREVIEYSK